MYFFTKLVLLLSVIYFCECGFHIHTSCENEIIYLKCNRNEKIKIMSVFYGRTREKICPDQYSDTYVRCSSSDCKKNIITVCNNKRSCNFKVGNDICGEDSDWHSNTHKHIKIKYNCVTCNSNDSGNSSDDEPPILSCGNFEEVKYNVSSCQQRCPSSRRNRSCRKIRGGSCVCIEGYVIDTITKNCVQADRCPYYNPYDPSETTEEHYVECGYCDGCPEDCSKTKFCTKECKPSGYYCKPGYCRDENKLCIKKC